MGQRADPDGRLTIGPQSGVIYTRVSRALLGRALRIGQALIAQAQRRGWEVAPVDKSAYGYRRRGDRHRWPQLLGDLLGRERERLGLLVDLDAVAVTLRQGRTRGRGSSSS